MLGRETLFIIGAGAGHDIEMPMGEKLASTIAANLNIVFEDFGQKKRSGHDTMIDALRLVARQDNPSGDVNPYFNAGRQIHEGLLGWFSSIDGYLNRHQDQPFVQQCGKMAIVQCILESEHACHMHINQMPGTTPAFRDAEKLRSSWFQRLWAILETGIVRSKNLDSIFDKLHVITFNYDRTSKKRKPPQSSMPDWISITSTGRSRTCHGKTRDMDLASAGNLVETNSSRSGRGSKHSMRKWRTRNSLRSCPRKLPPRRELSSSASTSMNKVCAYYALRLLRMAAR